MTPLAQFRDSYLIAEDDGGLVILDQHAAHERVLFERYLEEAEAGRVETQQLLFPVTVELRPHERLLLEAEVLEFRRLGFHVEPFGGDAVRIDGVPAVAADLDPATILKDLIGEAAQARSATAAAEPLRRRLVITAACRAAIKVRRPLSRGEMQELLDALMRCTSPTTCPHGRPVLFRLRLEDVERAFRRR
jgi:DNA mismatch repair protein MutL